MCRQESTGNVWQGPGGQCWPGEHKCRGTVEPTSPLHAAITRLVHSGLSLFGADLAAVNEHGLLHYDTQFHTERERERERKRERETMIFWQSLSHVLDTRETEFSTLASISLLTRAPLLGPSGRSLAPAAPPGKPRCCLRAGERQQDWQSCRMEISGNPACRTPIPLGSMFDNFGHPAGSMFDTPPRL